MTPKEEAFRYLEREFGLPNFPNRLKILTAIDIALQEQAKEIRQWILDNLENGEQIVFEFDKKFSGEKK